VKTVDGDEEIDIQPGIQPGTVITLENKGVPRLGNAVSRGNHLITVTVEIPKKIGIEERELLEKLAKLRGDRVDKGGVEGLFGKIFGT